MTQLEAYSPLPERTLSQPGRLDSTHARSNRALRVVHLEVGGSFGGSTKALAAYLKYADTKTLRHDLIFYFPTPEAETTFQGLADNIRVLTSLRRRGKGRLSPLGRALRKITQMIGGETLYTTVIEFTDLLIGFRLVRPLAEIIAAGDYDVVHINNTFTYQSASILAATMARRPIVAHVQNPVRVTLLNRWLASRVWALIAINHQIEKDLAEGKIGCPLQTIYDSAEVASISPDQIARTRAEFAPDDMILVGSVGRLELQKGYRGLITAAREIVSKNSAVRFVVIGEGNERENLQREIEAAGIQDNFVLCGFRNDVLAIVAALDVFVCSSEYEGGPIALIEAMLLERPVVTTDVGLAREVIADNNGIVVNVGDSSELTKALLHIVSLSPNDRRKMGSAARQRVLEFADVPRLAAQMDEALRKVFHSNKSCASDGTLSGKREVSYPRMAIDGTLSSQGSRVTAEPAFPFSVSIVIPTKNRPRSLRELIERILRQTILPKEVVVIDQSPDESSLLQVEEEFSRAPLFVRQHIELRYFREVVVTGAASARNRGLECAQSDIILFFDDDIIPEDDYIEKILEAFHKDNSAIGVSGVITNYLRPRFSFRLWNWLFVRGPFHDDRQPIYWNAHLLSTSAPIRVKALGAGLMAFKAAAVKHHRFDQNLIGAEPGEDVDFCERLHRKLLINPAARSSHRRNVANRQSFHWLQLHAQSAYYLYSRNWRGGLRNRLCLGWLTFGYALVATLATVRRRSTRPWRSLLSGIRRAHALAS